MSFSSSGGKNLPGVSVEIGGGRSIALPPLSLAGLRRVNAQVEICSGIKGAPSIEQQDAILDILLESARRNYPALERDDLLEVIDVANFGEIFVGVMTLSTGARARPSELEAMGAPPVPGEASGPQSSPSTGSTG